MEQLLTDGTCIDPIPTVRRTASVMTAPADGGLHQVHIRIRTYVLNCFYYLYALGMSWLCLR